MRKKILFIVIGLVLAIGLFVVFVSNNEVSGTPITIHKSPTCGCCVGHASELGRNDFDVNVIPDQNLESLKLENNIPRELWSCHTSFVEGYFVEGHVPLEAIDKLLEERPDIDGISLPGMPSGSPGMPGYKNKEWIIYSIKDGIHSEFMRI